MSTTYVGCRGPRGESLPCPRLPPCPEPIVPSVPGVRYEARWGRKTARSPGSTARRPSWQRAAVPRSPAAQQAAWTVRIVSPAHFTLDRQRALVWAARAVPAAGWRPALDRDGSAVNEMIAGAREAGIISGAAQWSLSYARVHGDDGPGYRWFLTSRDPDPPLILADAFSDSWPAGSGSAAVAGMLDEAVDSANSMLDDLDRRLARVPPAVWVVRHAHGHHSEVTAHAGEAAAWHALADPARDSWADIAWWNDDLPRSPDGLSDEETARTYLRLVGDDYFIGEVPVTGISGMPAPTQASATAATASPPPGAPMTGSPAEGNPHPGPAPGPSPRPQPRGRARWAEPDGPETPFPPEAGM